MRPTFKKLEVKDIADLERLVAENVEGIEPGLKVIDSRLLLGQAAIDLVGLDAKGALVLIALDFTADESLLLRVMDAYSWCLEYPETIRLLADSLVIGSHSHPIFPQPLELMQKYAEAIQRVFAKRNDAADEPVLVRIVDFQHLRKGYVGVVEEHYFFASVEVKYASAIDCS